MAMSRFAVLSALLLVSACQPSFVGASQSDTLPPASPSAPGFAPLVSPWTGLVIVPRVGAGNIKCPTTPTPYTGDMDFPSKYEGSGSSRSTINPVALMNYKLATADIEDFEKGLAAMADRHVKGEPGAAACAMGWIQDWAKAGALAGDASAQGEAVRKWALGTVSFSYLRLQAGYTPDRRRDAVVREWLAARAAQVIAEQAQIPAERINNHRYWAAAAVGATAIVLDRRDLFDWSMESYRIAARAVDARGHLRTELGRGSRALFYHNYALTPLAMISDLGQVNGIDLLAENDCALCRLSGAVIAGVRDKGADFFALTGERQQFDGVADGQALAWLAPLAAQCSGEAGVVAMARKYAPLATRRLGGNLGDTYQRVTGSRSVSSSSSCRALARNFEGVKP